MSGGLLGLLTDALRKSGAYVDNTVLRADGTTGKVQSSLANLEDDGTFWLPNNVVVAWGNSLLGPQISGDYPSKTMTVYIDNTTKIQGLGGVSGGWTVTTPTFTYTGSHFVVTSGADWTVQGVTYTTAMVDRLFKLSAANPSNNYALIGDGTNWITSTPAQARTALGYGAPEHALKTTAQTVTSEATITYDSIAIDSSEVTHSSGEFIVGVTGTWQIDASWFYGAPSSQLEVWLTDDTASVGSDVETGGTRRITTAQFASASMHAVLALDSGDTVRFRSQRTSGAGTCTVDEMRVTVRRIA